MKPATGVRSAPRRRPVFPPAVWGVLVQLNRARRCAAELELSPWQFAVSLASLLGDGLTEADLRRLVHQGLVEHGQETTTLSDSHRVFVRSGPLGLTPASCFVLSPAGRALVSGKGVPDRIPEG
jgi:hypothetical protein